MITTIGKKWRRWGMAGSLNIRILNNITDIAQGDTASTIVVELQDENKLPIYTLNGRSAQVNLIDKKGEIKQQYNTFVFDSIVEFNLDATIPIGSYRVEIRVSAEDSLYVFPSKVNYILKVNKSANHFYNVVLDADGTEIVANLVFDRINEEAGGFVDHIERKDNPHNVTKSQVGLGSVSNYPVATKEQAEAGTDNDKYMTPLRTKEAIEALMPGGGGGGTGELNVTSIPYEIPHDYYSHSRTGLYNIGGVLIASNIYLTYTGEGVAPGERLIRIKHTDLTNNSDAYFEMDAYKVKVFMADEDGEVIEVEEKFEYGVISEDGETVGTYSIKAPEGGNTFVLQVSGIGFVI